MTKLADRLFHRTKQAPRVPAEVVVPPTAPGAPTEQGAPTPARAKQAWATAPAGNCDICSARLYGSDGRCVPAAQFTDAVQRGYNPLASGRVPASMAVLLGSGADPYQAWRGMALGIGSATDWALCDECADDLARYIARH